MRREPHEIVTLTREQSREVDRLAMEKLGLPGVVLMENAAAALEEAAVELLSGASPDGLTLAVCGPGNNGGDGLALVRRLHNRGRRCAALLTATADAFGGDAATQLGVVCHLAIPVEDVDGGDPSAALEHMLSTHGRPALIVDAIVGTGATGRLRPPADALARWITAMRREGSRVLAVDCPSGLDVDTGAPLGSAEDSAVVEADHTVTLAGMKPGLTDPRSARYAGVVSVGDIGVPPELLRRAASRT